MSRRWKIVYGGEWVSVRVMMNRHFRASGPCAICRVLQCGPVWYSIKTGEVRCQRCFTPEDEL